MCKLYESQITSLSDCLLVDFMTDRCTILIGQSTYKETLSNEGMGQLDTALFISSLCSLLCGNIIIWLLTLSLDHRKLILPSTCLSPHHQEYTGYPCRDAADILSAGIALLHNYTHFKVQSRFQTAFFRAAGKIIAEK